MRRHNFLMIFFTLCSVTVFGQKTRKINVPDSIQAYRQAEIFVTAMDYSAEELKTVLTNVYCFDKQQNIIYNFDKQGLYLAYEYDAANNMIAEYFFEDIDSTSGKRLPSAKWIYTYSNGLRDQIIQYVYVNGEWEVEDTVRNIYKLDKYGRIIENKYFVGNELKRTYIYSYDSKKPKSKIKHDFNSGWLKNHTCAKEIEKDASNRIITTTTFKYDSLGNCIQSITENTEDENITRTTTREFLYAANGLLVQEDKEIVLYGIRSGALFNDIYEYNEEGFVIKIISNLPESQTSVKEYKYMK